MAVFRLILFFCINISLFKSIATESIAAFKTSAYNNTNIQGPETCKLQSKLLKCDFETPKQPIALLTPVVYSGYNLAQCKQHMSDYRWPVGFFCPSSSFCGFGLKLGEDMRSKAVAALRPLREVCNLIINSTIHTCKAIKETLHSMGLLRQRSFSCSFGGTEYCRDKLLAECYDVKGGFKCEKCLEGAEPKEPPKQSSCIDINECDLGFCRNNSISCENKVLSYDCVCEQGYQHITTSYGNNCTDINECETADICGEEGNCTNKNGSFECFCKTGFVAVDGSKTCVDINECEDPSYCQNGTCVNNPGSFNCTCQEGFEFDGQTCKDIDECTNDTFCLNGNCTNLVGSFNCSCFEHYRFNGKTCTEISCDEEYNECTHDIVQNGTTGFMCTRKQKAVDPIETQPCPDNCTCGGHAVKEYKCMWWEGTSLNNCTNFTALRNESHKCTSVDLEGLVRCGNRCFVDRLTVKTADVESAHSNDNFLVWAYFGEKYCYLGSVSGGTRGSLNSYNTASSSWCQIKLCIHKDDVFDYVIVQSRGENGWYVEHITLEFNGHNVTYVGGTVPTRLDDWKKAQFNKT